MVQLPYPMWVVVCDRCGPVCTVWEKPGTGCTYFEFCPSCGDSWPDTEKVESYEEHTETLKGTEVKIQA